MVNSIKLWGDIIPSPIKGFSKVDEKTKILMPIIIVLLLVLAASALLIPILNSDAYADALMRTQISDLMEKGTELSAEQIDQMTQQLQSENMKKIMLVSSVVGGVFGYALMLTVSIFLIKLFTIIVKEHVSLKIILRIMIYIGLIGVVHLLTKNCITLFTNHGRILARVQSTADLQYALTSPVSLAALFDPGKINRTVYNLIDSLTDIFNWLYYGYLFAGLKGAAKLRTSTALKITIAIAVIMIGFGIVVMMIAG